MYRFRNWYWVRNTEINFAACMIILLVVLFVVLFWASMENTRKEADCHMINRVYVERMDACVDAARPWENR